MNDTINLNKPVDVVCIVCPNGCRIHCEPAADGARFSGYRCKRGVAYATAELTHPMRSLTTSVKTAFADAPVLSVRTNGEIDKAKLCDVARALAGVTVERRIRIGDVVAENICGTGVNVICTSDRLVNSY